MAKNIFTTETFVQGITGLLSNLKTTYKSNLVGAINENYDEINTLSVSTVGGKSLPKGSDQTKIWTWNESGIYLTNASGITDLPFGWPQGRHEVIVFSVGNPNYSMQLITPYAGVDGNKKLAFRSNLVEGSTWRELSTIEKTNTLIKQVSEMEIQMMEKGMM